MSDRINVIRAPRDSEHAYLAISRALTQDRRLSFEARGVLAYLLSKPSDWIVRVQDLQKEGSCGRDRIYRILKELREAGYLHRDQEHQPNGTFTWGPYRVYEEPFTEKPDMDTRHQKATQPFTEKPDTVKPYPANTEMAKQGKAHQKATQPYPALPYTENTDIYIEESSTDQRSLQTSPPPPAASRNQSGGGDGQKQISPPYQPDPMRTMLRSFKIGASAEIAQLFRERCPDLDVETVRQSIENQLADKVSIGAIVKWLREDPPEPGQPYPRTKALNGSGPLTATRPNVPPDALSPAEVAKLARAKRGTT